MLAFVGSCTERAVCRVCNDPSISAQLRPPKPTPHIGFSPAHRQDVGAALRRKLLGIVKTSLYKKLREHDPMRADDRDD
jgi:hypothetical protein